MPQNPPLLEHIALTAEIVFDVDVVVRLQLCKCCDDQREDRHDDFRTRTKCSNKQAARSSWTTQAPHKMAEVISGVWWQLGEEPNVTRRG